MKIMAKITSETEETITQHSPPLYLKHKAIFMVPYEPFDGCYSENGEETDGKYLSIGLPQWRSSDEGAEISLKVWRKPDNRWSRQSEEIPAHRTIDLCILLVKSFYQPQSKINNDLLIRAGTFERQEEDMIPLNISDIPNKFFEGEIGQEDNSENNRLKCRLRQLRDELNNASLD